VPYFAQVFKECLPFFNAKQYFITPICKIRLNLFDEIQGTFYEQELQKTNQEVYRIEKIIRKGGDMSSVKWLGYPKSFNSWVENNDLIKLYHVKIPISTSCL